MKHILSRATRALVACTVLLILTSGVACSQRPAELPRPDHIVVVILENHSYADIVGSAAAPYINALAADPSSALFTQSYAIEHPSQPNYLDFFSGSNQGVTDDNLPASTPFTTANLGRQLIDAGLSFATYSEDLPSVGFSGATSGNYARKHNPAANWMGTGANQIPATTNQPLTAFPTDFTKLPTVCYVVPNLNDDMHNGTDPQTITAGDGWVHTHLDSYIQWAKSHNSLLILTFDEDDNSASNQIVTVVTGQPVKPGSYSEKINHYSVLRTIEDLYALPYAGKAATASTIPDTWLSNASVLNKETSSATSISIYPNPVTATATIRFGTEQQSFAQVSIVNGLGAVVAELFSGELAAGDHSLHWNPIALPAGSYECRIQTDRSFTHSPLLLIR